MQIQQPPCLNVPLQVNVHLTLKPGAFQRMLQSKVFSHCFSFLHSSAKAFVLKPLATRDVAQPQNLTGSELRLLRTLIKAAWSSLTAICESTLVKSLPLLAQMLSSNPGRCSQASEICILKMHQIQKKRGDLAQPFVEVISSTRRAVRTGQGAAHSLWKDHRSASWQLPAGCTVLAGIWHIAREARRSC